MYAILSLDSNKVTFVHFETEMVTDDAYAKKGKQADLRIRPASTDGIIVHNAASHRSKQEC